MVDHLHWTLGSGFRPWPYDDALAALRDARIPTGLVERLGRSLWSGTVQAPGTQAALLRAARTLESRTTGAVHGPAITEIACAGHRWFDTRSKRRFYVTVRAGMDVRKLVTAYGQRERVVYNPHDGPYPDAGGPTEQWELETRDPSAVRRAIQYLDHPKVLAAFPSGDRTYVVADTRVYGPPVHQGVFGEVRYTEGNCAPTIGRSQTSCRSRPYASEVYVYSPPIDRGEPPPEQDPIATVRSDARGRFSVELELGDYSIYVKDDGQPRCRWGTDTASCPHTVRAGEASWLEINVDHAAH